MTAMIADRRSRFDALLSGSANALHDRPLLARSAWVVAPTVGAIVPGWLLIIPRAPALSFKAWSRMSGQQPEALVQDVQDHLGLDPNEVLWFEHGPNVEGTTIGCGLDHAHIHVLIRPSFSFDAFRELAREMSALRWEEGSWELGYSTLQVGKSYFIAGSGDQLIKSTDVESAGSEFFRRVVAAAAGVEVQWNYRQFPQLENVASTIRTFQALEGNSLRER
jgi:ATP adenylyltransferase